ncbi:hypothetical protein CR203_04135 [Salipaludibacillus neizhouensis]|uniref:Uncharacterized protein n=1 Tax=Salipaludibacillus neizhouensis TaxID=885475 RepID=A0A3A9KC61_9BACI|nr:hypothetical protein CR203_04135 [Salipaludibacillus neizhouensis]
MKRIEWILAISLVVIGLSCLTMSANWLVTPDSMRPYLNTLFLICFWACVPIIVATLLYLIFRKKKGDS